MSQSNRVSLFALFFLFFLPMISPDYSLVFFSAISMKRAPSFVWFVPKQIVPCAVAPPSVLPMLARQAG
jgi:hypothetical protein